MPDRLYKTPTGVIRITEDGRVIVDQPTQGGRGGGAGDPNAPRPFADEQGPAPLPSAGELTRAGAKAGLSVIPGAGVLGTALRVAGPPLLEELFGSKEAAKTDTLWSAGGEAVSRALPYVGTLTALASGGQLKEGAKKALPAFVKDANERWFPQLVGRQREGNLLTEALSPSSGRLRDVRGAAVEAAELASQQDVGLPDLVVPDKAGAIRKPISRGEALQTFNDDTLVELAIERQLKPNFPNATDAELRAIWENGPTGLVPLNAPPGYAAAAKKQWQQNLITRTRLSARDLGQMKRAESGPAKRVLQARSSGTFVPEASEQNAQFAEDFMALARDLLHGPLDVGQPQSRVAQFLGRTPKPGETGAIAAADELMSRQIAMDEINKAIGGKNFLTNPGAIATRGALGYTLFNPVIGNPTAASMAGMALLSPPILSALGVYGGRAAKAAPFAFHYGPEAVSQWEKRKGTKRREPSR